MQFLHPWFLWALLAVAIPVIIHLFNFRRFKTVYFSNVRFLKEVKEETTSRNKLKHLLVLAARILALTFLVLAFAQPFIPGKKARLSSGKKVVGVYLDNSFSMNAVSNNLSLLDKAKQAAKEIAAGFSADDQFQLLTNDFEGKHQRLVGKEEFLTMVDEVEVSPAVRPLTDVARRQKDALSRENSPNKVAYLLSDFQKSTGSFTPDSAIQYNLIPLAADAQANLYIDTCWLNEPVQLQGQPLTLVVKVSNSGENDVEGNRMVFKLNGQTKTMNSLNVAAGSYVYDTISFVSNRAGWNTAEISITDFPITYDDNYFIAFDVVDKIKVVALTDATPNRYLEALFKNQPEFDYTWLTPAGFQPEALQQCRLVVLGNLKTITPALGASLNSYIADGGAVLVFPAEKCEADAYNRFLNNLRANSITGYSTQPQETGSINLQQSVWKDVFEKVPGNMNLPAVRQHYTFSQSTTSGEEAILTLKDGNPFFSRYPYLLGALYVCASPLDKAYSDLPVHAIFVPLLYKIAVLNIRGGNIAYFIGDQTRVEVEAVKKTGENIYKVKGDDVEFIPEQFAVGNKMLLGLSKQVQKAGFYTVSLENTDMNETLALNFDRKESALSFFSAANLAEQYNLPNVSVVNGAHAEVAAVVKELDRGTALWKWCLILALIFLAAEIALLRFWKI